MIQEVQFIPCAVIGAPFGVRGAIHVYPSSGQCDHLLDLKIFYRKIGDNYVPLTVTSLRQHQDHLVISFQEITTPEQVKLFVHQHLYLTVESLPTLASGRYFWFQLENMTVVSLEGHNLGAVRELYSNGPQDIILTDLEYHIPFVRPAIVKNVDLEAKIITVDFNPVYEEA